MTTGSIDDSDDINRVNHTLHNSTISGPWRLTVWEKQGHPPSYIFSEEHDSEGSCADQRDISAILREILDNTRRTEVFIEHFIHAEEITTPRSDMQKGCVARSSSILNGLRLCLEVVKISSTKHANRIHFCDPRCDIVSVMPDGKVYDAIEAHVKQLTEAGMVSEALLTLYEAFIHPLLSVVPDGMNMHGRLSGSMKTARDNMTDPQLEFFDGMWRMDVVTSIKNLTEAYGNMHSASDVSNAKAFMIQYTKTINKFMDTWLLAQMFHAENSGMSASVLYLGSLHSLNMEKYLQAYGYTRTSLHENRNLAACLAIK